ncbi:nuclear transport factor 2 family protein [Mycobacterium paraterrae]|uniref:Nuclear transport factor 2 family protein n=1 Tax=Mycobacterium paraterrae TaxID=577492 RepID=A0ABY3VTB3_9MYCO|nr:nuclear transport factor 2 family protein [Mycobacterium paraterrae]UMB71880.1 nuclear transport factor 2 family protein [Mycobacterium paraterrae]
MTVSADDRTTLSDLVHRYAARIDDRQFDSLAELFTDDAQLVLPDPPTALEPVTTYSGHVGIGAALETVAATVRTQHAIVGEVYETGPHPESAGGRISCIAHHWVRHEDQIRDVTWYLRYVDEYRRDVDGTWRIRRRALTIDAIDTRPVRRVRPRQS